ncbi:flagellar basal body-associated FliL family protein [Blastococcus sp. VKM Ac-2987]|uniref:flagellar basal body-associated FliL family protein n=1 Tax=Blastococcus sp. VKM Ac-2987 TaxID=3004141 RepID=UPI0022AB6E84|nr:flagellar basal body-associated FliL family protein [Blastococcus sp. VKM Ac-2987]MCZ2858068.1 flagellar basal body-associated FliL family protein [Blastococcus sp. VKM Ac-2987]
MSKDKTAPAPADGEEGEGRGGKKKLLLVLAAVLLAGAGAGYFFLFAGSAEAEAVEPVSSGTYLPLEPVAVNLAGGGYLKIGVALELTEEGAAAGDGHGGGGVDGTKALDLVISTFSQAAPADVTGAREALKESLQAKIVEAYTDHDVKAVMGIYYTEYVTQ